MYNKMSKNNKRIERLLNKPKDYTFDDAKALLESLGYKLENKGKTSGSRVIFKRESLFIMLHKPHSPNIMKQYAIRDLINNLIENGDINE